MYESSNPDTIYKSEWKTNGSGYEMKLRHYKSSDCTDWSAQKRLHEGTGKSGDLVSLVYFRQKQRVRDILKSEGGYALLVCRMIESESVFGQLKNNRGFRRFLLF
ncbi:transposase [Paenibacillus oenotherae]|uniref:transposase n=1 Tax=Paenibacillus oenotherae TaxID=1435645 RepID=UPI0031BB3E91